MISVCIITKNEREYLLRNLQILKKYQCEIVVVDTGSTDGSVDIAEKYADICGYFEWCDDFSKARNYAVSLATNDIILSLDTDELIEKFETKEIEEILGENPRGVGKITCISSYATKDENNTVVDAISRVFDRRYYQYEGSIHEQLVPLRKEGNYSFKAPVVINHLGYNQQGEDRHKKAERNINLLMKEYKKNPDDAYIIYQIGRAYMYDENYVEAIKWFEKTFEMELNTEFSWVETLVVSAGNLYISLGQKERALELECLEDEFINSADYHFMMGYVFMQNMLFDKAIEWFLKASSMKECKSIGNNSYNAFYNIGVIYECTGQKELALEYYRKCGDFDKALIGIKRLEK